jgi:hypothetical protein
MVSNLSKNINIFDLDKVYSLDFGPIDLGHYGIPSSQIGSSKWEFILGFQIIHPFHSPKAFVLL